MDGALQPCELSQVDQHPLHLHQREHQWAVQRLEVEAPAAHQAYLEATTTSGKSATYDEGTYTMPFVINVSYP